MGTKPLKTIKFPDNEDVFEVTDETARKQASAAVKTINGIAPDATGNVEMETPGSGTIDSDTIAQAVEAYLEANPPEQSGTGSPGQAATLQITGADALEAGAAPTVTEQDGSTAQARVYRLGIPAGKGVLSMTYDAATNLWTVTFTDDTTQTVEGPSIPVLSSSVTSASTATAATSSAVKQAYDKAAAAMPKGGGTFTGAAYAVSGAGTAAQLRNTGLYAAETDPTVNGQINWTYE